MIKFYNSLSKKVESFHPINKNRVKIYSCGPTVYDFVHIGNLRSFVFVDILVRVLKYFNYEVENVINLTDVDDKTIKKSKTILDEVKDPKIALKKITDKYTKYFLEDIDKLNIQRPTFLPKATESIKDMEFLINLLYEKGYAYISDDGIYMDLSKVKDYGKLVEIDFNSQKYNKENRVVEDEYDKEEKADFALWKFKKEENEPSWEIRIGDKIYKGRPGWHIECSAMSYHYLGKIFDIHTGGIDLKFPHHENEICQSSCALGINVQANYWLHNEHLMVDGRKMSKSLNNFYTLRFLINEKGYNPLALREFFLRGHYRTQINFTFEALNQAQKNVEKINNFYEYLENKIPYTYNSEDELNENFKKFEKFYYNYLDQFEIALKDDLNTPVALAAVYEFIREVYKKENLSKKEIKLALEFMDRTNNVLALKEEIKEKAPQEILELALKRMEARKCKDFALADMLRDEIKKKGYEIIDKKDVKNGFIIKKIEN